MSYGFNMAFAKVPKNDLGKAMAYAKEFVGIQMLKAKDIIEDNKYYIPSVRYCPFGIPEGADPAWKEADRFWLNQLFSFRFVYWAQYGVLGCCINDESNEKASFPLSVYFQNSCDQDYEFSTWEDGNIPFFMDKIAKAKAADSEKVIAAHGCGEDCPEDYCRRAFLYDSIFSDLQLNNWLYGTEGNFERFSLCGIETTEQHNTLNLLLRRKVKQWLSEK